MSSLAQVAARARVYPFQKARPVSHGRRVIIAGNPHLALVRAIAKHERSAVSAFVKVMLKPQVSEDAIAQTVAQGSPTPSFEHEVKDLFGAYLSALGKVRDRMSEPVIAHVAQSVERHARRKATLFNSEPAKSRLAATYAKRDKALIVNLTAEQRRATYRALSRAATESLHPHEVAKAIRDSIGMTEQMTQRLANYEGQLFEKGYVGEQFTRAVERFAGQLIRQRAETIARTEMSWAHNRAQIDTMQEASAQLDMPMVKEWFGADDELECPVCLALNGERVPLDATFSDGEEGPPDHPNCRCGLIYDVA